MPVRAHQGKPVENADRPGMPVEQLSEVRLAHPPVDVRADLDADELRDNSRASESPGEIDLAEAAHADRPLDAVAEFRFRADDDLRAFQQVRLERNTEGPEGKSRGCGSVLHHMDSP